jgi:hypothetical protein
MVLRIYFFIKKAQKCKSFLSLKFFRQVFSFCLFCIFAPNSQERGVFARGIAAEPATKPRSGGVADGADSPTPRSGGSPKSSYSGLK